MSNTVVPSPKKRAAWPIWVGLGVLAVLAMIVFTTVGARSYVPTSISIGSRTVPTAPTATYTPPRSTVPTATAPTTTTPTPTTTAAPVKPCAELATLGTAALDAKEAEKAAYTAQVQAERDYHAGGPYEPYAAAKDAWTTALHTSQDADTAWDHRYYKDAKSCAELGAAYRHVKDADWRRVSTGQSSPGYDAALAELAAARTEWDAAAAEATK